MSRLLSVLKDRITKFISTPAQQQVGQRKYIRERLREGQQLCRNFIDAVERLTEAERKMFSEKIKMAAKSSNAIQSMPVLGIYNEIIKTLSVHTTSKEDGIFGAGLIPAVRNALETAEAIEDQLDDLFPSEVVALEELTISQAMMIAFMASIIRVGRGCTSIFLLLQTVVHASTPKSAPWRSDELFQHRLDLVQDLTIFAMRDAKQLTNKLVKQLKDTNNNLKLVSQDGLPNVMFLNANTMDLFTSEALVRHISQWNPIRIIGEWWIVGKAHLIMRTEGEKDLMETHVALLRLQLNNVDSNDPEFMRLSKIIANYQARIDAAERKIANYRRSDREVI